MVACSVSVTTVADGVETKFDYTGEMSLGLQSVQIRWKETQAEVLLSVKEDTAEIKRAGDYSLNLFLKKGATLVGRIGISGSEGEVQTYTRYFAYSIREKSALLSFKYDLIIGAEKQRMEIRILARQNGNYIDKAGETI